MLNKIFRKKSIELKAHATGKFVNLEDISDPVFSQKMMGEGMAIEPSEGEIVSPVEGEIVQTFSTKHAIGIKAKNGAEILIHIGLETVSLKGEGFSTYVEQGQKVEAGDLLVTVNLDFLKEKEIDIVTPLVVTNIDTMDTIDVDGSFTDITKSVDTTLTVVAK